MTTEQRTGREITGLTGQVLPELVRDPVEVLENARTAAKALMTVVEQKKHPVIMNGEQYLEFEDWQTVGQFYGYAVKTLDAIPVEVNDSKGAKAAALLINMKTGEVVGGAEAYCMRDEPKWNTRPKYEYQGEGEDRKRVQVGEEPVPWFQLASMAQTRAGAKAYRNRLAWVAVLAGYRPTPAEEMLGEEGNPGHPTVIDKSQHWCSIHKTPFFKKGKMSAFAHPIGDTGKWCHEPAESPKPTPETPQATTSPVKAESKVEVPPEVEDLGKELGEKVGAKTSTAAQRAKLFQKAKSMTYSEADLRNILEKCYHKKNTIDLTSAEVEEFIGKVESGATINTETGEWN